jgi:hypothetical protein
LFLDIFNYVIILKPGKYNKADGLSRRPDYKEGIASENAEHVLLTPEKFLLKPKQFEIWALHNMVILTGMDIDLKEAIEKGIKEDCLTGDKLKEILLSGPRHITKELQEWNYENRLMLYKGLVYVPNNEALKRKIIQQFYDNLMEHPGQWKTLKLITQEYYWPGMTEFVKAYIKGCATCQTTKIRPPVKVPLKPTEIPEGPWETITIDFITDLPISKGYDSILTVIDHYSKAIIVSPYNKTIIVEQTSQLLIDNV